MTLTELGWNEFNQREWNRCDRTDHLPARVVEEQREIWTVAGKNGDWPASLSGRLRHRIEDTGDRPAIGDWVEAAGGGMIYDVLPRRTRLSRQASGRRMGEQIVAANIDTVLIVSSLNRDYNPRRLERYLALVWEGGAEPVIVLSKSDLCDDVPAYLADTLAVAPSVPLLAISALAGVGVDLLAPYLQSGRTIAIVGSSGVGKSTLINTLAGTHLTVAATRNDDRGRHTTTARQLIPLESGALLIDTPGMRELQLWSTGEGVEHVFEDVEAFARDCRFRDCSHESEPGCAVLQAMEQGTISQERYESFFKLRREANYFVRKQDVHLQLEQKRKWKAIHKAQKKMKHLKGGDF